MGGIKCCKDCTKRYIGCHSNCDDYLKEKKAIEEQKRIAKEDKNYIISQNDFNISAYSYRRNKR